MSFWQLGTVQLIAVKSVLSFTDYVLVRLNVNYDDDYDLYV